MLDDHAGALMLVSNKNMSNMLLESLLTWVVIHIETDYMYINIDFIVNRLLEMANVLV